MSQTANSLATLAGTQSEHAPIKPPSRAPLLLSIGLLVLLALFAAASWESWMPQRQVEVLRVIASSRQAETGNTAPEGSVAFQAAGWVEADPFPTHASALVNGVINSVAVRDGEAVSKGQELARLDTADFAIALEHSEAQLRAARASRKQSQHALHSARARVATQQKHIQVFQARIAERRESAERFTGAAEAVSALARRQTQLALATAEAELSVANSDLHLLQSQVEEAAAELEQRAAAVQTAQVSRDKAQLDLERCTIRAPIAGRLQQLHVAPGSKIVSGSDNPYSRSIATLYDPQALQVRVDVSLVDSAGLFIDQKTKITCSALPGKTFNGTVTRLLGHADISRNTLQAKVAIEDADELLRPEMLVKVQFLTAANQEQQAASNESSSTLACFLPAERLSLSEGGQQVWIVNDQMRLEQRAITVGGMTDDYRHIPEGLRPGEWVVINPAADLAVGERVQVQEAQP